MDVPTADFRHVISLTGTYGTYEFATGVTPQVEHGYRTDDVARVLVAAMREPILTRDVMRVAQTSMQFLVQAQRPDGRIRGRRSHYGTWFGDFGAGDSWGHALWAFGTAAARLPYAGARMEMVAAFSCGARVEPALPRALAFAALGAGELLRFDPRHPGARGLIEAAAHALDRPDVGNGWAWPEDRLSNANAVLPQALLVAGHYLGESRLIDDGLRQLAWLCGTETRDGHLSVTPATGRDRHDVGALFEQRPVEVAGLADACVQAYGLTDDPMWLDPLAMSIDWFTGNNDVGVAMIDPETGGCFDGLTASGPSPNQGAESTLAAVMTLQHAPLMALVTAP